MPTFTPVWKVTYSPDLSTFTVQHNGVNVANVQAVEIDVHADNGTTQVIANVAVRVDDTFSPNHLKNDLMVGVDATAKAAFQAQVDKKTPFQTLKSAPGDSVVLTLTGGTAKWGLGVTGGGADSVLMQKSGDVISEWTLADIKVLLDKKENFVASQVTVQIPDPYSPTQITDTLMAGVDAGTKAAFTAEVNGQPWLTDPLRHDPGDLVSIGWSGGPL